MLTRFSAKPPANCVNRSGESSGIRNQRETSPPGYAGRNPTQWNNERMPVRFYTFAAMFSTLLLAGCGNRSPSITLPNDVSRLEIFAYDIYHPYDRNSLLSDPESTYGAPLDSGRLFEDSSSHLDYLEYKGTHGLIRICDGNHHTDGTLHTERFLEFYPPHEHVADIVQTRFLADYVSEDTRHSLVFRGGKIRGIIFLNVENGFVNQVIDRDW
jgi:hypothetical protein